MTVEKCASVPIQYRRDLINDIKVRANNLVLNILVIEITDQLVTSNFIGTISR